MEGYESKLERRVFAAAEAALDNRREVSALDVLLGLRWLVPAHVDTWRQGRVDHLQRLAQVGPDRIDDAVAALRRWAADRGLVPAEVEYISRRRDRRPLRFTADGDEAVERVYRTHWTPAELSESARQKLVERSSKAPDLVVITPLKDWTCAGCGETEGDLLIMDDAGPLCLACADLDHLVFLPAGDTALTRRARTSSGLSAVVVRFSRSRKRYERQGVLVEEAALADAEQRCLADEEVRRRRRERAEEARARQDVEFEGELAAEIRRLFPSCPRDRAAAIAIHAAARGSGRVGRTAAGRSLDTGAVTAAVVASVRHVDTPYDELLMDGVPRDVARARVRAQVDVVLDRWQRG